MSVASPTGRVEGVRREAPNERWTGIRAVPPPPASLPALHRTHGGGSYLILSYLLLISYLYLSDLSIILLLKGAISRSFATTSKNTGGAIAFVCYNLNNRRRLSNQNPSLERPHQSKPTALQGTPAMPLRRALPCRRRRCSTPSCSALRCARAASALRPRRLCASAPMVPHHGHTLTQLVLERTFPTCRFDPNPSTKVPWPQAVHLCACTQPSVPTPLLQARG